MKHVLANLKPNSGATHRLKIIGRGPGSGLGKTSGKGQKGQLSRSGGGPRVGFEGGQIPFFQRIPKRGFKNINQQKYQIINLADLEKLTFDFAKPITREVLYSAHLIKHQNQKVKLLANLGDGGFHKKVIISVDRVSRAAKEKILELGGQILEEK